MTDKTEKSNEQANSAPKYGAIADENTKWVYGDTVQQGGDPQAYVAEQRRMEEAEIERELERTRRQEGTKNATQRKAHSFFSTDKPDIEVANTDNASTDQSYLGKSNKDGDNPFPNSQYGCGAPNANYNMMPAPGYMPNGMGPKAPSRGKPIAMLVVGLVIMFVLTPAFLIGSSTVALVSGNDVSGITTGKYKTKVSGGHLLAVIVATENAKYAVECTVKNNDTVLSERLQSREHAKFDDDNAVGVYYVPEAGSLNISCASKTGNVPTAMWVYPEIDLTTFTVLGLISILLGFVGLIIAICGFVWLIRNDRKRKAISHQYNYR